MRAGLRIGSRFIREDEAEQRFGRRKKTKDVVALIVERRAGDLHQSGVVGPAIEAQLAQPGSVEHRRAAPVGFRRFRETCGPWGAVRVSWRLQSLVYATIVPKKERASPAADQLDGRSSFLLAWSSAATTSAPSIWVTSCWPFSQAGRPGPTAVCLERSAETIGCGRLPRHHLQPVLGAHPLDVATQRRNIELQQIANLSRPGNAELRRHDEDVQLADPQTQGPQAGVIDVAHHPIQRAQPDADARFGDGVDRGWRTCPLSILSGCRH